MTTSDKEGVAISDYYDVGRSDEKENICEMMSSDNIVGQEADAVMLIMLSECQEQSDFVELHDLIGHSNFVALALEDDEAKEVEKVHRYFGHKSGRKTWELFAKAGRLRKKKKAVLDLLGKCRICCELKKTPPRPRVGLPIANTFNEVVGLDLKVLGNGRYILWIVDLFTKALKGQYIENKQPETIVAAIIKSWIIGDGFGPGHPSKCFYSDNGGEFSNQELIDFASSIDTTIKMTSAYAPWQNGIVERNHATADIIFEKLLRENPKMKPQEAVNHAALAKNSETNRSGFSPLQLIMGHNPAFPGLGEVTPASSNMNESSKAMKALKEIDKARVMFRETDCDERLKRIRGQKINPSVERDYKMGEPVFFRDDRKKEWKPGTALVRYGKTLYLRYGNWLRRVPVDTVIPDPDGKGKEEEGFIDPDDVDVSEDVEENDTPAAEIVGDITAAQENNALKDRIKELESKMEEVKANKLCEQNNIVEKRKERRKRQRERKEQMKVKFPTLGENILYKEVGQESWIKARVFRVFKKTSKYKHVKQLALEDGSCTEKNFETEIAEWKPLADFEDASLEEDEEVYFTLTSGESEGDIFS